MSPGGRLREARNAARLSLDDVAMRLRLERRVVDALERDDYSALPQPTFVRGYLRGYARLLELPPGPIVEAYDRMGFTPPGLVPDISSRPETRSTDMPVRVVTYALVAGLLVLGVLWWRSEKSPSPTPLDLVGLEPRLDPGRTEPAEEPPAPTPREAPPPPPATALSPPATPPAPLPTPAVAETGQETPAPARPPAPPSPGPAAAPAAAPALVATASTPPTPDAGQPSPGAGDGSRRLVLRLKHDSWVEVYDGGGKRLFFNLAKAGQTLSLTGSPPLRVILGYARDAEVEYNGERFDAAPHTNRDIARFTVGG